MSEPYCFDIETLLNECQPDSVLVMGCGANEAVDNYAEQKRTLGRDCRIDRLAAAEAGAIARRYDLGIVTETIEALGKREALHLLSRLRDLHTARFCLAVPVGEDWQGLKSTWTSNELLAVGMTLVNSYENEPGRRLHLYKYDIGTYKATPRWLNPDDWANPELWNKYRW
ncbi:MAG: DUF6231 family protein [Arenicellales bacterium]